MILQNNVNFIRLNNGYTYKTVNGARIFNAIENKNGSIRVICRRAEIAKILEKITKRTCSIGKEVRNYHKYTLTVNNDELTSFILALDGINCDERLDNRNGNSNSLKLITQSKIIDEKPRKTRKTNAIKKIATTKR